MSAALRRNYRMHQWALGLFDCRAVTGVQIDMFNKAMIIAASEHQIEGGGKKTSDQDLESLIGGSLIPCGLFVVCGSITHYP